MKTYYKNILRCWEILRPFHKWFYIDISLIFILQGLDVYATYATSHILTSISNYDFNKAVLFIVIFICANIINFIIDYISAQIRYTKLEQNIYQHTKSLSFEKILNLNISQQIEDHSLVKKQNLDDGEIAIKSIVEIITNELLPVFFLMTISIY
jgi:ABC-type multidrug transport system fused ATPase/permease subunit